MERVYTPAIQKQLRELAESDLYKNRNPRGNYVGRRFGRLEVIRAVGHAARGRLIVLSHCDCGGARICTYDALRNGIKSCGCWQDERQPKQKKIRQFNELMLRVIKDSRTAKPVDAIATDINGDEDG